MEPALSSQTPLGEWDGAEMSVTLSSQGRVLLHINVWYLVLSALLRMEPPFSLCKALEEGMLIATIQKGKNFYSILIAQPVELKGNSQNETERET